MIKKKITIELSDSGLEALEAFLASTEFCEDLGTSNGPLTLESLTSMLLEDVALSRRRPGSWEGSNMCEVLRGHGYA